MLVDLADLERAYLEERPDPGELLQHLRDGAPRRAEGPLPGRFRERSALAGEPITWILTRAPGNDAPICGLRAAIASGWFAARPSGTEALCKIHAESFHDEHHVQALVDEAQRIVRNV